MTKLEELAQTICDIADCGYEKVIRERIETVLKPLLDALELAQINLSDAETFAVRHERLTLAAAFHATYLQIGEQLSQWRKP